MCTSFMCPEHNTGNVYRLLLSCFGGITQSTNYVLLNCTMCIQFQICIGLAQKAQWSNNFALISKQDFAVAQWPSKAE